MGKQRRRPKPRPSPEVRRKNWAKITPERVREIDYFAQDAFLSDSDSPPQFDHSPWYATATSDPETRGEP